MDNQRRYDQGGDRAHEVRSRDFGIVDRDEIGGVERRERVEGNRDLGRVGMRGVENRGGENVVNNTEIGVIWGDEKGVVENTGIGAELAAEQELVRVNSELMNPEGVVGEETEIQRKEYLREDTEDLRNEIGGEGVLSFEHEAAVKGEKEVTEEVMNEVEKIVSRGGGFRPAEIDRIYRKGTIARLGVMNREIGERNNAA